jgi:hypothetical protein
MNIFSGRVAGKTSSEGLTADVMYCMYPTFTMSLGRQDKYRSAASFNKDYNILIAPNVSMSDRLQIPKPRRNASKPISSPDDTHRLADGARQSIAHSSPPVSALPFVGVLALPRPARFE